MPRLGRSQPFAPIRKTRIQFAPAPTISVTSLVPYQFFWRGLSGSATIAIGGAFGGWPGGAIQWSSDGGSTWATLVATPSGSTYSANVTLPTGQYPISVRSASNTSVTATVTPISVAYVLATAGQSNSTGRATNAQTVYTPPGLVPSLHTLTGYAVLADPYGLSVDGAATGGSFAPRMVSALTQAVGAPFGIVPCGSGGTSITQWQPGGALYIELVARALAVGGCDGVLWWQGESDANASMGQATYLSNLTSLVAGVQSDLNCAFLPCQLQLLDTGFASLINQSAINAAIAQAVSTLAGCKAGPILASIPCEPESQYHLMTDPKIGQAAGMWAVKVYEALYQPAGGGGLFTNSFSGGLL